jgi:hypothetical protein
MFGSGFRSSTNVRRFLIAAALGASAIVANVGAVSAAGFPRGCDGPYLYDYCDERAYNPHWEFDCPQCGVSILPREEDWRVLFDQQSVVLDQQFQR